MTSAATLARQFARLAEVAGRSVDEQAVALGLSRLSVYALRSKARKAGFNVVRPQPPKHGAERRLDAVAAEMTETCGRCHLHLPHAVCLGRAEQFMRTGLSTGRLFTAGRKLRRPMLDEGREFR